MKSYVNICCDVNNINCIIGHCTYCMDYITIDEVLNFCDIKCSKECLQTGVDCNGFGHTIKTKQFEKVLYIHKGKEKKKIALVDKNMTFQDFIDLFKKTVEWFSWTSF